MLTPLDSEQDAAAIEGAKFLKQMQTDFDCREPVHAVPRARSVIDESIVK